MTTPRAGAASTRWPDVFTFIRFVEIICILPGLFFNFESKIRFRGYTNVMKTIKLKTDIKCGGCVAKVTPALNAVAGEHAWQVDVTDPARILTVTGDHVSEQQIIQAINKAGFKGERVN
jgi:copper chaperone